MKEKTQVEDIDRSIYDIKDKENDAYRMEAGLTPEIIEKLSKEKPTLPISPKWKKRNAYSVKSYWKRNANGQNEPTGKRNFPERS